MKTGPDMMDKSLIKELGMVSESFKPLMEIFIWGIGKRTDFMVMGFMFTKMGKDTKGNFTKV